MSFLTNAGTWTLVAQIGTAVVACLSVGVSFAGVWALTLRNKEAEERNAEFARYRAESGERIAAAQKDAAEANARAATLESGNLVLQKDVAAAQKEAAEAQLALKKYRAPRVDALNPVRLNGIIDGLKPFAGTEFDAAIAISDSECGGLLEILEALFKGAGLVQRAWQDKIPTGLVYLRADKLPVGGANANGLILEVDSKAHPELWPVAQGIAAVLHSQGIPTMAMNNVRTNAGNSDLIHLVVGQKR